ncbi:putative 30S ribosomal protein S15 [Toxoplasma gondii p89]|uniref:Putative 30S ribosomal protein S15 n=1 Tax=Toxoplasma gondii p89 TaxID=943119 RepID=A0A086JI09_TOXGO|nr:putative 30S ribosomal protein S15 [Toxoplasma gondii p89]
MWRSDGAAQLECVAVESERLFFLRVHLRSFFPFEVSSCVFLRQNDCNVANLFSAKIHPFRVAHRASRRPRIGSVVLHARFPPSASAVCVFGCRSLVPRFLGESSPKCTCVGNGVACAVRFSSARFRPRQLKQADGKVVRFTRHPMEQPSSAWNLPKEHRPSLSRAWPYGVLEERLKGNYVIQNPTAAGLGYCPAPLFF